MSTSLSNIFLRSSALEIVLVKISIFFTSKVRNELTILLADPPAPKISMSFLDKSIFLFWRSLRKPLPSVLYAVIFLS